MPSLALTKEEIIQSLEMEIFDREGGQADAHALKDLPLDGHWITIGLKDVVKILRYYSSDDGATHVQRNDRVEMIIRNGVCIAFAVGQLGFERCKVEVKLI